MKPISSTRRGRIDGRLAAAVVLPVLAFPAFAETNVEIYGIIDAGLSRGLAGVSGSTLVVNVAGSRYAVRDGMATLNPLAVQIIGQLSSLEI